MKKTQLDKLIKEEISRVLKESYSRGRIAKDDQYGTRNQKTTKQLAIVMDALPNIDQDEVMRAIDVINYYGNREYEGYVFEKISKEEFEIMQDLLLSSFQKSR